MPRELQPNQDTGQGATAQKKQTVAHPFKTMPAMLRPPRIPGTLRIGAHLCICVQFGASRRPRIGRQCRPPLKGSQDWVVNHRHTHPPCQSCPHNLRNAVRSMTKSWKTLLSPPRRLKKLTRAPALLGLCGCMTRGSPCDRSEPTAAMGERSLAPAGSNPCIWLFRRKNMAQVATGNPHPP